MRLPAGGMGDKMEFRYQLPEPFVEQALNLREFANGGMQVTIVTKDGRVHSGVLISACRYIVAMRDHDDLPFSPQDISEVYQTDEDRDPKPGGRWRWWDEWEQAATAFQQRCSRA